MANCAINSITFYCDTVIADIIISQIVSDGEVDFQTVVPPPKKKARPLAEDDPWDDSLPDIREEEVEAKKNIRWCESTEVGEGPMYRRLQFVTRYSPASGFIQDLAEKYKVNFKYDYRCEMLNYSGCQVWREGKLEQNFVLPDEDLEEMMTCDGEFETKWTEVSKPEHKF